MCMPGLTDFLNRCLDITHEIGWRHEVNDENIIQAICNALEVLISAPSSVLRQLIMPFIQAPPTVIESLLKWLTAVFEPASPTMTESILNWLRAIFSPAPSSLTESILNLAKAAFNSAEEIVISASYILPALILLLGLGFIAVATSLWCHYRHINCLKARSNERNPEVENDLRNKDDADNIIESETLDVRESSTRNLDIPIEEEAASCIVDIHQCTWTVSESLTNRSGVVSENCVSLSHKAEILTSPTETTNKTRPAIDILAMKDQTTKQTKQYDNTDKTSSYDSRPLEQTNHVADTTDKKILEIEDTQGGVGIVNKPTNKKLLMNDASGDANKKYTKTVITDIAPETTRIALNSGETLLVTERSPTSGKKPSKVYASYISAWKSSTKKVSPSKIKRRIDLFNKSSRVQSAKKGSTIFNRTPLSNTIYERSDKRSPLFDESDKLKQRHEMFAKSDRNASPSGSKNLPTFYAIISDNKSPITDRSASSRETPLHVSASPYKAPLHVSCKYDNTSLQVSSSSDKMPLKVSATLDEKPQHVSPGLNKSPLQISASSDKIPLQISASSGNIPLHVSAVSEKTPLQTTATSVETIPQLYASDASGRNLLAHKRYDNYGWISRNAYVCYVPYKTRRGTDVSDVSSASDGPNILKKTSSLDFEFKNSNIGSLTANASYNVNQTTPNIHADDIPDRKSPESEKPDNKKPKAEVSAKLNTTSSVSCETIKKKSMHFSVDISPTTDVSKSQSAPNEGHVDFFDKSNRTAQAGSTPQNSSRRSSRSLTPCNPLIPPQNSVEIGSGDVNDTATSLGTSYHVGHFIPGFGYGLEIVNVLGRGSQATLYKVHDGKSDYAAKLSHSDAMTAELISEYEILSSLNHRNVIAVHGKSYRGFLLDCLEQDLQSLIDNSGHIAPKVRDNLAIGILEGVAYIHANGIAHLDIKSENILLTASGVPKLCDFGLAVKYRKPDGSMFDLESYHGTPHYVSPEMFRKAIFASDDVIDLPKSDCWSVGVTLFQIMSGQHLFAGITEMEVFQNQRTNNYNYPTFLTNLSPADQDYFDFMDMIKGLCDNNPKERHSASEALKHDCFKQTEEIYM